jgi:hypothetical protein
MPAITVIQSAIGGQYGAALTMLHRCVENAEAGTWLAPVGQFPFWHIAYHTLFFADLYLAPEEKAFEPQEFHRADYQFLGPQSWAPQKKFIADKPYDQQTLAAYLQTCRAKAKQVVAGEADAILAGPSGFSWLPFTRLELHLYNIRHIQHHAGQLGAALRRQGNKGVGWVRSERV